MRNTRLVSLTAALFIFAFTARSGPLVYVVAGGITGAGTFATMDLYTGAFTPVGPPEPDGYDGLTAGPNGMLYTTTYAANIDAIDPKTGAFTNVGPSGLGSCVIPSPACGPNSALLVGGIGGKLFATDFANNVYSVNPANGAAKFLSASGIPPFPFVVGSQNADGTVNVGDVAMFSAGGKLYQIFDSFILDPNTNTVQKILISPELYQLDQTTGQATPITPIPLGFAAAVELDGTVYAFNDFASQIDTLNVSTGATSFVTNFDPSVNLVLGAVPVPTPEPASLTLAVAGGLVLGLGVWRRRHSSHRQ